MHCIKYTYIAWYHAFFQGGKNIEITFNPYQLYDELEGRS